MLRKLFYDIYGKCIDDLFKVFFDYLVGKFGKWFVGVKVYIFLFVNEIEEEEFEEFEEFEEGEDDFEFLEWW